MKIDYWEKPYFHYMIYLIIKMTNSSIFISNIYNTKNYLIQIDNNEPLLNEVFPVAEDVLELEDSDEKSEVSLVYTENIILKIKDNPVNMWCTNQHQRASL